MQSLASSPGSSHLTLRRCNETGNKAMQSLLEGDTEKVYYFSKLTNGSSTAYY